MNTASEIEVAKIFNSPVKLGNISNKDITVYARDIGLVCSEMLCLNEIVFTLLEEINQ